jgi:prevent-host-death family protein
MKTTWQLQEAKARFSEVVQQALQGQPQHVTKRGEEAVVIISHREYQRLSQGQKSLREALSGAPRTELQVHRDRTPVRATRLG